MLEISTNTEEEFNELDPSTILVVHADTDREVLTSTLEYIRAGYMEDSEGTEVPTNSELLKIRATEDNYGTYNGNNTEIILMRTAQGVPWLEKLRGVHF